MNYIYLFWYNMVHGDVLYPEKAVSSQHGAQDASLGDKYYNVTRSRQGPLNYTYLTRSG